MFQKCQLHWKTSLKLARQDNEEWKAAQKYVAKNHVATPTQDIRRSHS